MSLLLNINIGTCMFMIRSQVYHPPPKKKNKKQTQPCFWMKPLDDCWLVDDRQGYWAEFF